MNRLQASPRRAKAYTASPDLTRLDPAELHLTIPFNPSLPISPALPRLTPPLPQPLPASPDLKRLPAEPHLTIPFTLLLPASPRITQPYPTPYPTLSYTFLLQPWAWRTACTWCGPRRKCGWTAPTLASSKCGLREWARGLACSKSGQQVWAIWR